MIKVDQTNIEQTKQFVINNLKRSGFIYGNLTHPEATSYIDIKDDKIVAMTNSLSGKYVTYLFPKNTNEQVIRETIEYMQNKPHIGGTVTGDYYDIFNEYYSLPNNALNEVASLSAESTKFSAKHARYATNEDVESYTSAINTIEEFSVTRTNESIKEMFSRSKTVLIKKDDKVISGATLSSISDKTAVVTGVFTVKGEEGKGYARDCMSKLLKDYAEGRTILIFFSNPIAKKLYLSLGFEVDDTLIMYDNK